MALSARIFGLSSWSILVPQALEGVAAVGFLYATVRRWFTPAAGLLAGAVLALTPISALMFRFNNPDALLVLLLTAGAYAMVRALEAASTRWLLLAFTLVGFGFLTKMLQALLVVPAFGLVYLIAAPTPLRRRLGQLIGAGVALLVSAGWWVAIVELIPASARPYIGGSQDNSLLEPDLRLQRPRPADGQRGRQRRRRWRAGRGTLGPDRMDPHVQRRVRRSGLVAAAGRADPAGRRCWCSPGEPRERTAPAPQSCCGAAGSSSPPPCSASSQGIIHPYYTVALAPAIGALVGIGAAVLWRRRHEVVARIALAVAIAATAVWAAVLLGRTPSWVPWLRPLVLVLGLGAAIAVALGPILTARAGRYIVGAALVAALAGPAAYSLVDGPHGARRGPPHGRPRHRSGVRPRRRWTWRPGRPGRLPRRLRGRRLRRPAAGGAARRARARLLRARGRPGRCRCGRGRAGRRGRPGGRPGGGVGGLLNASTPSSELVQTLLQGSDQYTWVAATIGANQASGYQLATDASVMPIGGFNGSDPSPTLAQFQQLRGRRPHPLLHQRWLRRRRPGWRQQRHRPARSPRG